MSCFVNSVETPERGTCLFYLKSWKFCCMSAMSAYSIKRLPDIQHFPYTIISIRQYIYTIEFRGYISCLIYNSLANLVLEYVILFLVS